MNRSWALPLLVVVPLLTACSASDPGEQVVNVYSARHYDTDDALYRAFTERTGIAVNLLEDKADVLLERIRSEGQNGPADLFVTVDAGRLYQAEQQSVFDSVDSPALDAAVPEHLRHPDGL